MAALEAEKFLSEAEPEGEKPAVSVERSAIQPAAQEVDTKVKKQANGATAEYRSNPLL